MSYINFKREILPHLLAVLIFVIVTVAFFSPIFFEGKSLPQHDITQWQGSAQELVEFRDATGEEGLWTNSMFGGMPAYLVNVKYSGEIHLFMHKAFGLFLPHPVGLILTAFICCYVMLIAFEVRPQISVAGAIAFGLTSFIIIGMSAGHNSKVAAIAYMPLVFAGVHLAFKGKNIWGFVLTALGMALHLRVNHFQITYYLLLIVLIYGINALIQALKNQTIPGLAKTVGILSVAVLLGLGANMGRFWGIAEYSPYSIRGKSDLVKEGEQSSSGLDKSYAFEFSNGITEPLFLFIPNVYGGSSLQDLGNDSNVEKALRKNGVGRQQINQITKRAPAYWGQQRLSAPYYAGATVVFLFVLALLVLDRKLSIWLGIVAGLGIVLSWGDNFSALNYFLFDYLPGYNKFRSVTFTIIITVFGLVLGGFLGLEKFMSSDWNKKLNQKFLIALGATAGFALMCIAGAGMFDYVGPNDSNFGYPEWLIEALRKDRASLLRADAFRSLIFVCLLAAAIWAGIKNLVNKNLVYGLILLLVLVDIFSVEKRFINKDSFSRKSRKSEFNPTAADQLILKDNALSYRVLNLMNPFNEAKTSYHHKSIGGYHGAKMGRYQELVEKCISREMAKIIQNLQNGSLNYGRTPVLDMLNTKYLKAGETENAVIPTRSANGNAWFVSNILKVKTANQELDTLLGFDSKNVAVINESEFDLKNSTTSGAGLIHLETYQPNYLKYKVTASSNSLAVFSEIYYPKGWVAKIDGEEVDILRANYVLRALEVPQGEHTIEFEFAPRPYMVGNMGSGIFNILILLALGYALFDTYNRKK